MRMSGIYIPRVSVPADDTVLLRVYPEENGYYFVEKIDGIDQDFLGSYWAVSVPPHGRLIDADKIGLTDFEIILCQKGNPFKNALEMLLEKIENAPTVLEAEESKI